MMAGDAEISAPARHSQRGIDRRGRLSPNDRARRRARNPVGPAADGNALRATIRFAKLSALPAIIARLRRVFDLAADPVAIAAHLKQDPTLAPLIAARPGLRVPGAWDEFEQAVRAVLGHEIAVAAAVRLAERLVAAHGQPLAGPDRDLTHLFPQPAALAVADMTALGISKGRARRFARSPPPSSPIRICLARTEGSTRPLSGCGRRAGSAS